VKISPADFEINGLTKIVKIYFKKQHFISPPSAAQPGGLIQPGYVLHQRRVDHARTHADNILIGFNLKLSSIEDRGQTDSVAVLANLNPNFHPNLDL